MKLQKASLPGNLYSELSEPVQGASHISEVFVGGLNPSLTADDLKREMSRFGQVVSSRILCYKDGRPRGFGFVSFKTDAATQEVVRLKFIPISCCTVECKLAISKLESKQLSEKASFRKILIEGLKQECEEAVKEYFKKFGDITKFRYGSTKSKTTSVQKDYSKAVITFKEESAVRTCLSNRHIHQVLDSTVVVSGLETLAVLTNQTTQEKPNIPTNSSARTTARGLRELPFASHLIANEGKPKCSSISAGLKEAIRSAQLYPNINADNIEFRLNVGTRRQAGNTTEAWQFRQLHKLCQQSFMFGSK